MCVTVDDIVYMMVCNSENWHNADSYCVDKGGNLANLKQTTTVEAIQNYILHHRLTKDCSILFIGLHKSLWHAIEAENETSKIIWCDASLFFI